MKKHLLFFLFTCLSVLGVRAADYVLDKELTWDQVKSGSVSFALVSGSDVLYGTGAQNTGMAAVGTAVTADNGVSVWKVESVSAGFMFRGYNMAGTAYTVWGSEGYLNAQPSATGVSFILGKTEHTNGQDLDNGAVWTVTSTSGGYYIKNVGNNAYLNGTNTSASADKVWKFYSVKESTGSGSTQPGIDITVQDDSSTDKCTISHANGITTYTTISGGVNILFKMLNVDVTGYTQVKITFAEETEIPLTFSVGNGNIEIPAHSKSYTYDFSAGTTSLKELTLVALWQGAGKVVKIASVELTKNAGITHTLNVNGLTRSYDLYIPDNVAANPALVFSLHGASGHSNDYSPFGKTEANAKGCIVVYPQGVNQNFGPFGIVPGWDATGEKNIDYDFFKAIIEDVKNYHAFDAKRVYCCGFSNGGMMTYAMANAASDIFAAFASISGFPMNEFHHRHTGVSPRPFLHIHGANDDFVDIAHMPTIRDNMVARLGANPVPETTRVSGKYTKYDYRAETDGFPYTYYIIDGMGHNGYTSNTPEGNSTLTMWNFMSQYTLDSECDATLKWNPNLDAAGFVPSEHGWTVTNSNKTFVYGDKTPTSAPQISHSLQFEAGDYQLRFLTSGTAGNKISISLKNVNGTEVFTEEAAVGQKQDVSFSIPAYGEFTIMITKANANDKFTSLGIYETSGSSSAPSDKGINLTASMFHEWTGIDASATVKTENANCAYELNASTGLPYGDNNVSRFNYADLSSYGSLVVTASAGEPRFCFNRKPDDNNVVELEFPRDNDKKKYETITDNGDGTKAYTINLAAIVKEYGYAHLNCIKGANWANVTVTSMKLYETADSEPDVDPEPEPEPTPVPDGHTQLTADDFYEWTAADATGEKVKNTGCDYNLNVSTGMVYGTSTVNYLSYADLSKADKLYVTATGNEPRFLFNRLTDGGTVNVEFPRDAAAYETVVSNSDGSKTYIIDIASIVDNYGFAHLHAIKANWGGDTNVSSITYTVRTEFPTIPEDPTADVGSIGDVNGDEEVSIEDLTTLVDVLKNDTDNERADVNEDNRVDLEDVNSLANIMLGNELEYNWVGTWTTAQQLVEPGNLPPTPGLSGNSLRQIVQVSVGGKKVRLKFSNEFGTEPTEIKAVEIALAKSSGATAFVYENTSKSLTFNGQSSITIQPGKIVVSDPISYTLSPRDNVAITIHYGSCSNTSITGHPGSRTTSYIKKGNSSDFSSADARTDHWYNICCIDVVANKDSRAVAILGNSITDGRGSTTNQQNRWTDNFSRALLANESTKDVAVLNLGIGGNGVLGGLGPAAHERYDRDILQQAGVKYAIIFIGTNDVGGSTNSNDTYNKVTAYFANWIEKAHAAGIKIYGATITPFKGSGYYTAEHEALRKRINTWIRTCGLYDAVIDFDKIMQDPNDTESMPKSYFMDGTDGLHANAEGYLYMGNSIDLKLFENY